MDYPSLGETLASEVSFLRDELRRRDEQLEHQVADFQQRLAARELAEAELRRLLALALQTRALPAPRDAPEKPLHDETIPRPWWERWLWWWR